MATMTINVMGKDDSQKIMAIIMQSVSRTGKYELEIRDSVKAQDLMANKMVQYRILERKVVKNSQPNSKFYEYFEAPNDYYHYTEGENFAAANLKGAHKFIEEKNKRLNPSLIRSTFIKMDKSNIISAITGALFGSLVTIYFS